MKSIQRWILATAALCLHSAIALAAGQVPNPTNAPPSYTPRNVPVLTGSSNQQVTDSGRSVDFLAGTYIDASLYGVTPSGDSTAALQTALNAAASGKIAIVNLGTSSANIGSISIPDFVTLSCGVTPASKISTLRDYRLSTGIQGVLALSTAGSITLGAASGLRNCTVLRSDGSVPPTTFVAQTTRDGLTVKAAEAGTAILQPNPSAVVEGVSILGFDTGIISSSSSTKLIDVVCDCRTGVVYNGAESDQAQRLQIASQLTRTLDLSSGLLYLADDGSGQYEITWDVSATTQFSFNNGDTFYVQPPTNGGQSAAGGWVISKAAVRANGSKGCNRTQGCPGGTLTGSVSGGTTLSATWTNTADAAGDYYLTVTPGTTGPLVVNQNVSSATCIAGGTKIKDIWDAQGRIYLTAQPSCPAGPQNVVFTDDAWSSGGTGFVDPGGRTGDGILFTNSSGIKVDQSIIFAHDTELHFSDGARNNHVKGCTTGEDDSSLDDGKIGLLIDGSHAGNDPDTITVEDCNLGQHAFKSIIINSDSTKRDTFSDVVASPGTARTTGVSVEINSGAAQFSNLNTGGGRVNIFVADGTTYRTVYNDGDVPGSGYVVGDVLTTTGGTCSQQAQFTVDAVGGSGGIKSSGGGHQSRAFICTVYPTNPIATTGGTGTGAALLTDGLVPTTVAATNLTNRMSDLYMTTPLGTAFSGVNNRCSVMVVCNHTATLDAGALSVNGSAVVTGLNPTMIGTYSSVLSNVTGHIITQRTTATAGIQDSGIAIGSGDPNVCTNSASCTLSNKNVLGVSHTAVTSNTTLATTAQFWPCDATAGAVTITVPAGSTVPDQIWTVKKVDSSLNPCIVSRTGSDTLDGQSTRALSLQYDSVTIQNAGSTGVWRLTSKPVAYRLFTDFGGFPNTNSGPARAANDAAAAAISAACNAGALKGVLLPDGDISFNTDNPFNLTASLTAPGCNIGGIGPSTRLIAPSGTSVTTFLTVDGGAAGFYTGANFHDMTLQYNNTPTLGQAGIVLGHAADTRLYNLRWVTAARLISIGNASYAANKVHIWSWIGDFNKGTAEDCIICVYNASDVHFTMGDFNGSGVSDTNPNGAFIYEKTVSGGLIDTVTFTDWTLQSTDHTHGKPYGVVIDDTNGNVVNLRFLDSQLDWTTTCGVLETASPTAVGYIHMQDWIGMRITPATGCAVMFDVNGGLSAERIQFVNTHIFSRDSTIPFQILAAHDGGVTNYSNDSWNGGSVSELSSTSISAAFSVGANGWAFGGSPSVGPYNNVTNEFQHVYSVTDPGVTQVVFGLANAPSVPDFVLEPIYTTVGAPGRQITRPRSARTIALGTTATATIADSSIRFNSSSSSAKSLTLFACTAALDGVPFSVSDERGDAGTNAITITPTSSTINNGASSAISTNYGTANLQCDGHSTNWISF